MISTAFEVEMGENLNFPLCYVFRCARVGAEAATNAASKRSGKCSSAENRGTVEPRQSRGNTTGTVRNTNLRTPSV